jgi:rRNA biogenesis protein RRP5
MTINSEKRRISFGLKPSYFTDDDYEMHDAESSTHDPNDEQQGLTANANDNEEASDSEEDNEVCLTFLSQRMSHLC